MNTQISTFPQSFTYEGRSIRTAGTPDNPLFCAKDVATCLGYANPAKAVIDHCKGVTVLETPTTGGLQKLKFIAEPEVYRLVLKSNAPNAEQFQNWVCEEVLPAIRKTGQYAVGKTRAELLLEQAQLLVEQERRVSAVETRLEAVEAHQSRESVDYYSVVAFCNLHGIPCDLKTAAHIGKRATALSRQSGAIIGSVPDPRFGRVNTYHRTFIEMAAEELGLVQEVAI